MFAFRDNRGREWRPEPAPSAPPTARIPEDADPIVRFILREVRGTTALRALEAEAGLGLDTLRMWMYGRHKRGPLLMVVRAALNAMGYDLAIVPFNDRRRPDRPLNGSAPDAVLAGDHMVPCRCGGRSVFDARNPGPVFEHS